MDHLVSASAASTPLVDNNPLKKREQWNGHGGQVTMTLRSINNISESRVAALRASHSTKWGTVVGQKDMVRQERTSVLCFAALGSNNGNGRPGVGAKPFEGALDSKRLMQDDTTESDTYQPIEAENILESSRTRRKDRVLDRNSAAAQKKAADIEKRGEDPYRVLENGQKVYLDEFDVITLLEPPPFLRPMKTLYYNHAAYLWKKIEDIPEERRHRLLDLLLPRHITKMWELSKLRYEDPGLFEEDPKDMLCKHESFTSKNPMVWDGRVCQVPWYYTPFKKFQKAFFIGNEKKTYGRVMTGGRFLNSLTNRLAPLYFQVVKAESVVGTDEPCDLLLDYGEGQLHLRDSVPQGFPKPVKHIPPFNDKTCDYLRGVGPGVFVGQTWIDGKRLEQIPRKLFGEFIIVRRV